MARPTPPRVLTIAGSDSGGGAGIQADLKTIAAHGCYGTTALTAVTAQNTLGVLRVHEVPVEVVEAQIEAVLEDIGADAIKIGMLASAPIVHAVVRQLRRHPGLPMVVDPVMVAQSGDSLLQEEAVDALREGLLPLATVITPNLPEAWRLSGIEGESEESRRKMARALAALGPAVLVKGGHVEAGDEIVDLLFDGETFHRFVHPRLHSRSTHGTGCTLASAIAARLAWGERLRPAVEGAVEYLHRAMVSAYPVGQGSGPVDHFAGGRS